MLVEGPVGLQLGHISPDDIFGATVGYHALQMHETRVFDDHYGLCVVLSLQFGVDMSLICEKGAIFYC